MDEKFFHGIKTLLSFDPIHAPHPSQLANVMIDNVAVGTVIATESDDNDVFAFASVINCTTYADKPCLQAMKKLCLDKCPQQHKADLELVLSGNTKRPAGFMIHARMINVPLTIVESLHQQLVLDMDWAVENVEDLDERKSLDFGAFVVLAPCSAGEGGSPIYKYFEDEIFASNSEFVFTFDAPKGFATEERKLCSVIVLTKTGHRASMTEMANLIPR